MNNKKQSNGHILSDADNFMIGLQKNLMSRNNKLSFNDNTDYISNSRTNSYKKVVKPNNNNNNNSGFDRINDTRSNTYHFGNNNSSLNNLNVNYWMNNESTKIGNVKDGLNIYDERDDEDEEEDFDDDFDEDEANLKNTSFNHSIQFIDLNRVKYNNNNNSNNNMFDNRGVNMKFDQIEDARGNTISKPLNDFSDNFDNILVSNDNSTGNFMNYIINEDPNQAELFGPANNNNNNSGNMARLSTGDIFKTNNDISVKPEIMNEDELLNSIIEKPEIASSTTIFSNKNSNNNNNNNNNNAEETDDIKPSIENKKKKKKRVKVSHNVIEQKYRDNINEKILKFKDLVPTLQYCSQKDEFLADSNNETTNSAGETFQPDPLFLKKLDGLSPAKKMSKAIILGKTYEYIQHLEAKVERYEHQIKNYEQVLSGSNNNASIINTINNNIGKVMHTPISSVNQSNYSNTQQSFHQDKNLMTKSNSIGSSNSGEGSVTINNGNNNNTNRLENSGYKPNQIQQINTLQQHRMPMPPQDIRAPSLYYDNIPLKTISSTATSQSMSNSNNLSGSSINSSSHCDSFQNNITNTISHGLDSNSINKINSPINNIMLRNPSSNTNSTHFTANIGNNNQFGGFF
ncbi:hypothetical protein ACO0SA_000663 [Hanseniaspora valbyensis]